MSHGDIRDLLEALPHHPDGGHGYKTLPKLFPVRHRLIREFDPSPRSVFEFGALVGYFLVTALDAAPSIERVGWVDNEHHTPGSNLFCEVNVCARGYDGQVWYGFNRADVFTDPTLARERETFGLRYDLVQVDATHTYGECYADLCAAAALQPRWIFVDDWDAHAKGVQPAVAEFLEHARVFYDAEFELETHETENGLAVLTRR